MIKKTGFTITELLVSIAIITIVSTMVIFSFVQNQGRRILEQETNQFAAFIKETQNKALIGQKINNQVPAYGILTKLTPNPNQMIIYADLNGDFEYDGGEEVRTYTPSSRIVYEPCTAPLAQGKNFFDLIKIVKAQEEGYTETNFIFLPYKIIGGICAGSDCTAVGKKCVVKISNYDNPSQAKFIYLNLDTGTVEVYAEALPEAPVEEPTPPEEEPTPPEEEPTPPEEEPTPPPEELEPPPAELEPPPAELEPPAEEPAPAAEP